MTIQVDSPEALHADPKATISSKHKCLLELKAQIVLLNNFYEIIPLIDAYNIQDGQFSNDILRTYSHNSLSRCHSNVEQGRA